VNKCPKAHSLYRTRYAVPVPTPASSGAEALKSQGSGLYVS
jgi:hypothetical protein